MRINIFLEDSNMPRTIFWQNILDAISELADAEIDSSEIFIPAEDLAMETNWPRYGRGLSAYIRGDPHSLVAGSITMNYFDRVLQSAESNPGRNILLINMHPFFRVPLITRKYINIFTADVSLSMFERCCNKNTISMPALPIDAGNGGVVGVRKTNVFFQGVGSHLVRDRLRALNNENDIVINLVQKSIHNELKLDAITGVKDNSYSNALKESNFAIVPRGDALFSYRLLEVMSYGCIPVIISDGWVLPFDRQVNWPKIAFTIHEEMLLNYIPFLRNITQSEILEKQKLVMEIYEKYFRDLREMLKTVISEIKIIQS